MNKIIFCVLSFFAVALGKAKAFSLQKLGSALTVVAFFH